MRVVLDLFLKVDILYCYADISKDGGGQLDLLILDTLYKVSYTPLICCTFATFWGAFPVGCCQPMHDLLEFVWKMIEWTIIIFLYIDV